MIFETSWLLDLLSIPHFIYGVVLAYVFRKKIWWVFAFILGWEVLEQIVLYTGLRPAWTATYLFEREVVLTLSDIVVGFAGYFIGRYILFKSRMKGGENVIANSNKS